jgi:hypothetical protein
MSSHSAGPAAKHVPALQILNWGVSGSPEVELLGNQTSHRAFTADWINGEPPSTDSVACVQPEEGNLFIFDPATGALWHLALPSEDLMVMQVTEEVTVVHPPHFKEGDGVTMAKLPVHEDEEFMEILSAAN